MRLHHLEIQAFGPFADRQRVDFDALSAQGLFLLNGPTGAGKSSVLDAVCFALYGSVPGARQGAKRLRSDHAAEAVAPEVCLEFSAGDRRFRVVRSPAWERPASRGGGTTTEQARTLLSERVGDEWIQKSARNDEAGLELLSLLGMDKEQFTKVVLLPQGEFAAFLRADAKSRRELLQKLFSTTRFEDLEKLFTEESQRTTKTLAGQEERQRQLFQRAVDEAERHGLVAAETGVDPTSSAEHWAEAVQVLHAALSARWQAAVQDSSESGEARALADTALAELEERRTRTEALRRVRTQHQEHESRAPEIATLIDLLHRHEHARGLGTLLRQDEESGTAEERARARYNAELAGLGENGVALEYLDAGVEGSADVSRSGLSGAATASSAALGVLRAALPDELTLQAVSRELEERSEELGQLDERVAGAETALARAQRARTDDAETLVSLRATAGTMEHLRTDLAAAVTTEETVQSYLGAKERCAAVEGEYAAASERFLSLKAAWLATLQLRLEQAAEELAEQLEAGEPCPVCGSADHPAPVTAPTGERITLDREQVARHLQSEAEEVLQDIREARNELRVEVAELAARGGRQAPEAAAEAVRASRGALEAAEQAQADCDALQERIRLSLAEEERLDLLRGSLRDQRGMVEARRSSLLDQQAALAHRLAGLRADAGSLAERIDLVQRAHDELEAVRDALDVLGQCSARRAEDRTQLERALLGSPFATAEDAREALVPESRHEQVLAATRDHEVRGHRLDAAWEDDTVRAGVAEEENGIEPPSADDVRRAAALAVERRALAQQAGVRAEVLGHSVAQIETYARQLSDLEVEVAPLRERSALVAAVADTARGGGENLYKMSLATYVLASRLEQVAAAATERLLEMSDGRYALVHSDATAGNRRSGLGLNVIDGWTGNRRDTATLSGGESFMASLALALGLADVVQQEAGGLDIETLFVDEGFGSLDDQALEQVMDALEGLRSGGRVVGLVSHVAELKQRVGAQLQVIKGRQGSSLRIVEQPAGG